MKSIILLGLHHNLMDSVVKLYDIDSDLKLLRENGSTLEQQEKIKLWRSLLVKSFSRLILLVYASTLFVVTMRVKLNILGGYMYKEIDINDKTLTKDIQNHYLSLIHNFFLKGISELSQIISMQTEQTLLKYDLKQKLSLEEIEHIFINIQLLINSTLKSNKRNNLANILIKFEEKKSDFDLFHKILIETVDLLETEEFFLLFTQHTENGFSLCMDELATFFSPSQLNRSEIIKVDEEKAGFSIININTVKIPLAKIIPMINGLIPKKLNAQTLSSNIIRLLINSNKIKMFGANVYEVFSQ